jgi:cellulose biosynthesis protein BcsQ
MATRYAVGNNKGGTGKSNFVVNVAAALAEAGLSVLVCDMDPQANASRRLGAGFDPTNPTPTINEAIHANLEGVAADAIRPTGWEAPYRGLIDVIPARFDLENRVSEAGIIGAVGRLRKALHGVDLEYDVTLIDCPPSLGPLTQMALAAADAAICTTEPEYDSIDGAVRFIQFVNESGPELRNPNLRMAGVVITRVREKLSAHRYQLEGLSGVFGDGAVWEPHVPERTAFKDGADMSSPLRLIANRDAPAMAKLFAQLAKHVEKDITA